MRTLRLAAALVVLFLVPQPLPSGAAGHRDAPATTRDPLADAVDLYAFVSTERGRADFITLIANYVPFQDPGDGPSFYRFSDRVLYEFMVDVDGDAREDLTYQFLFRTTLANGNRRVYNVGSVGPPPRPWDPASQYVNLNLQQSYTLTEVRGDRRTGRATILLRDARVAPFHVGPRLTGTQGEYEALAGAAVHTIPDTDRMRVFAGPRADGFYADLAWRAGLAIPRPPVNSVKGFNVLSLAVELSIPRLISAGSNGIVGVWASASRRREAVQRWVQVSRLGNPLVSEMLLPPNVRDLHNATEPSSDGINVSEFIVRPGPTQGGRGLVSLLRNLTGCTATIGRADLQAAFLTGFTAGAIPGFPGNFTGPTIADVLRLNTNVAPSGRPHRLGLLEGDIFGFPNGRRVGDDVTDVILRIAGGELQPLGGLPACGAAARLTDHVDGPDMPYLTRFPYLSTPHPGPDLMTSR